MRGTLQFQGYKLQAMKFAELSGNLLYKVLQARSAVFVVEQQCVYLDIDGKDISAMHIMVLDDTDRLVAYCRVLSAKYNSNSYTSIGRVLVIPECRGTGIARQMINIAIDVCHQDYNSSNVKISAQTYLIKFYQSLGFVIDGEEYLEDGIEHIDMWLQI